MPTIRSISDAQSTDVLPGAPSNFEISAESVDAVTELLNAAEGMALLRLVATPVTRNGASGPVVSDNHICSECHRGKVLSGMAHAPSCGVGRVLAACALLRRSGAAAVFAESYRRGFQDGQQRTLDGMCNDADREQVARNREFLKSGHGRDEDVVEQFESLPAAEPRTTGMPSRLFALNWLKGMGFHLSPAEVEVLEVRAQRRVVCGRAIPVFGMPGRDVLTCDSEPGHGDAWHEDRVAGRKWVPEATEIHFHPSGLVETRLLGREPELAHPGVTAEEAAWVGGLPMWDAAAKDCCFNLSAPPVVGLCGCFPHGYVLARVYEVVREQAHHLHIDIEEVDNLKAGVTPAREIAYDAWNGDPFAGQFPNAVAVPLTASYLSCAVKRLQATLFAGRLTHDGNAQLRRALAKSTLRVTASGQLFPVFRVPPADREVVARAALLAVLLAVSRSVVEQEGSSSEAGQ